MVETVGNRVSTFVDRFLDKQVLIILEIGATPEHGVIGLILMEFLKIHSEHPNGGIEPLEGREDIHQEKLDRVSILDMRFFVC